MKPYRSAGTMLLIVCVLMTIAAPNARATTVLDQQFLLNNVRGGFTDGTGFRSAQTFTVGIAGTLSKIDIFHTDTPQFSGLDLLSTSDGVPINTIVGTGSLSSDIGGLAAFSVSLPVSIGDVLAIEPIVSGESGTWLAQIPGIFYSGGDDYFINPTVDINTFTSSEGDEDFQTFVTTSSVPEPTSLSLLAAALVFGLSRVKRQSRG